MIKDIFRLEVYGVKIHNQVVKPVAEKKAVEIMENNIKSVYDHYEIGYLCKHCRPASQLL